MVSMGKNLSAFSITTPLAKTMYHGQKFLFCSGSMDAPTEVDKEDEIVQERAEDFLAFFCDQCNTESQLISISGLTYPALSCLRGGVVTPQI
jgi:hypothetical protein